MGRNELKHIDKGVIYIPIKNDIKDDEINKIIKEYTDYTIVLFKSGKQPIKDVFKALISSKINTK